MNYEEFVSHFLWGHNGRVIGGEDEAFIIGDDGMPIPASLQFTAHAFAHGIAAPLSLELSACQIETQTGACHDADELVGHFAFNRKELERIAQQMGCGLQFTELGPENMNLAVTDLPPYQRWAAAHPEKISSACRVTSKHLHRAARSWEHAIAIYNDAVQQLPTLIALGDHSEGERIRLLSSLHAYFIPPQVQSPQEVYELYRDAGALSRFGDLWAAVRFSAGRQDEKPPTVEFRMFGNTDDLDEVHHWAQTILALGE